MNKKLKLSLVLSAIVIAVASFFYKQNKSDYQSLALQNIEAIAFGELGSGRCTGTGCVDCPFMDIKVEYYVMYRLPLEKY